MSNAAKFREFKFTSGLGRALECAQKRHYLQDFRIAKYVPISAPLYTIIGVSLIELMPIRMQTYLACLYCRC